MRAVLLGALALLACETASGSGTAGAGGVPNGDGPGTSDAGAESPLHIVRVAPNHVGTLGGERITVTGRGFAAGITARLGDTEAAVSEVRGDTLVLTAPALPPGLADLVLTLDGVGTAALRDAVVVEPMSVVYDAAPETWAEAPEAERVLDAVPFDVEGDGDLDVVVATSDGLRVLANDGRGQLLLQRRETAEGSQPIVPGGRGEVLGLLVADLDADAKPEVVACTAGARDLHLDASLTGLTDRADLPLRAGRCLALAVVPGTAGARPSLVTGRQTPESAAWVTLYRPDAAGRWAAAPELVSAPPENVVLGTGETQDAVFMQSFLRVTDDVRDGAGAARLGYALTAAGPLARFHVPLARPWDTPPEHLRFALRGTAEATVELRLGLVDAAGVTFVSPVLPAAGAAWADVDATGPYTAEDGSGAAPTPPFSRLDFVVGSPVGPPAATLEGALFLDTVLAEHAGQMPEMLDDFERDVPTLAFDGVSRLLVGDLDADAVPDVVVLPGGEPGARPSVLRTAEVEAGAYRVEAMPVGGPGPFNTGALLDADRDGALDAVLVSGAQDRLLVGDGWGRLLDATFGLLPVDWADGRSVQVIDANADGLPDLLVGNAGKTDRLYLGRGDGRFLDATPELGLAADDTAAIVALDLDADGDFDVVSLPADGNRAPRVRIARGGDHDAPAP
jgi:hypothetical protein